MGVHLSLKQKYEIILYKERHPRASYADLKNIFDFTFNQNIGKTTFRNIFQNKNSIISQFMNHSNKNAKRIAVGKYNDIEEAIKIWIDVQEARNNPINDDLINEKAAIFAKELGIDNFNLSKGTLWRFKNRNGFKSYNAIGEMAEVNLKECENSINGIKVILKDYRKKIYLIWTKLVCIIECYLQKASHLLQ
ncbi:Jerky like protein-like [Dictyocoela muelleri]|nr:Jerky like protein-like [Dictyocoela muelleri]